MPKLLDLFCGAGGAAMSYYRAGFEVVGVDIKPQKNYPFEFHQADAMTYPLDVFDAIHASPPCQAYSVLRRANPKAIYPELILQIRQRLKDCGIPYVIENVPGAPLINPLILCGSIFQLGAAQQQKRPGFKVQTWRQLRRHRLFESNVPLAPPSPCNHKGEAIGVYGGGGGVGRYTFENGVNKGLKSNRGGYQGTFLEKQEAMDINWMTQQELNQAIPPAYTEFIGKQLMQTLQHQTQTIDSP